MKHVTLKSLIGPHKLSGCDLSSETYVTGFGDYEDASIIRFCLDGVTYTAVENPEDGYRSSLNYVFVGGEVKNAFEPIDIVGVFVRDKINSRDDDVLSFVDVQTGKVVIEVGTDYSDDYYPSFVSYFMPTNMILNANVATAEPDTTVSSETDEQFQILLDEIARLRAALRRISVISKEEIDSKSEEVIQIAMEVAERKRGERT